MFTRRTRARAQCTCEHAHAYTRVNKYKHTHAHTSAHWPTTQRRQRSSVGRVIFVASMRAHVQCQRTHMQRIPVRIAAAAAETATVSRRRRADSQWSPTRLVVVFGVLQLVVDEATERSQTALSALPSSRSTVSKACEIFLPKFKRFAWCVKKFVVTLV